MKTKEIIKKIWQNAPSKVKRSTKSAIIIAMAAIAGTNYAQEQAAMRAAMQDMKQDGEKMFSVNYTWDPFQDGLIA